MISFLVCFFDLFRQNRKIYFWRVGLPEPRCFRPPVGHIFLCLLVIFFVFLFFRHQDAFTPFFSSPRLPTSVSPRMEFSVRSEHTGFPLHTRQCSYQMLSDSRTTNSLLFRFGIITYVSTVSSPLRKRRILHGTMKVWHDLAWNHEGAGQTAPCQAGDRHAYAQREAPAGRPAGPRG